MPFEGGKKRNLISTRMALAQTKLPVWKKLPTTTMVFTLENKNRSATKTELIKLEDGFFQPNSLVCYKCPWWAFLNFIFWMNNVIFDED